MSRHSLIFSFLIGPLLFSTSASAGDIVDLAAVVKTACSGIRDSKEEKLVPLERLAEAILYQAGYPPSRLLSDTPVSSESYKHLLISTVIDPPSSIETHTKNAIKSYVLRLGQDLHPDSNVSAKARGIKVIPPFPNDTSDHAWLFKNADSIRVACMPGKTTSGVLAPKSVPPIGLVKRVEDLALSSQDRKKADSATIGFKRDKTQGSDGSNKTTKNITFDGVLGLRLTDNSEIDTIFAFANYTLARNRTKPAPPLNPGQRTGDKDTNGLELGISTVRSIVVNDGTFVGDISGKFGFTSDYSKGSRRVVGSIALTPGWMPVDLGICSLGALKRIEITPIELRTQCFIQGELEYSHVFKAGRAEFNKHGDFLSTGVVIGMDVTPPLLEKSGVIGSLRYRYLPTISGEAPTIKRLEASLKYRWWLNDGTAVDFGVTYKHGEELKTYTNEDSINLSLGFLL